MEPYGSKFAVLPEHIHAEIEDLLTQLITTNQRSIEKVLISYLECSGRIIPIQGSSLGEGVLKTQMS